LYKSKLREIEMNEEKEKIDAALAGQLLSVWMPYGLFVK
jgi:hypothetical protein